MKAFLPAFSLGASIFAASLAMAEDRSQFVDKFDVQKSDLSSSGHSGYFVLEPGFVAVLEGTEKGEPVVLTITVTDRTKTVDGVETRVVEERETAGGHVVEISLNYFAISRKTGDVYYFGEDSDTYAHGKVVNHDGSWLSGVAGAHFGMALPGRPRVGAAYYQELAPKVAMDRARVVSVSETIQTPAGEFKNCVKTEETTPLEKGMESKIYAPGVGLVQDAHLKLVRVRRP